MKLPLAIKGIILGTISGLTAVGLAFAVGDVVRAKAVASDKSQTVTAPPSLRFGTASPSADRQARQGYALFMMNCAHCHGNDARGDEGPDLHGLTKSDARISSVIKNGIKGEMPKFGAKLTDTDVQALTAFIRSLKGK